MSGKRKKVTWQVVASIEGRQWPIGVETDIPASSIQEMNEALEGVAHWFLKNNIYPQGLPAPALTTRLPDKDEPMPEAHAVLLGDIPVCPHCKKEMTPSKHQQSMSEISYYCPTRFGDGGYCKWRGFFCQRDARTDTWKVKDPKEVKKL